MMMGVICGGWQMLTALVAIDKAPSSTPFMQNKRAVAQFYMQHILPRYLTHEAQINAGSEALMAMQDSDF